MNTNNLRTFLQGDGIWILTAIAVLLAIKAWRNSSWLQLFSVVGFYAVIVSIAERTRYPKSSRLVPTTLRY